MQIMGFSVRHYIASEIKLIEKNLSKKLINEVKIISTMLQKLIVSLKPKT